MIYSKNIEQSTIVPIALLRHHKII